MSQNAFVGPWQPTKSRLGDSQVWGKAKRPGPSDYKLPGAMGGQMDSTKRSHHGFGFGSEPRLNTTSMASYSRGPDSTLEASVGKQVTSKRPNAPRSHFGTSTREAASIQYSCFTFKPQ